MIFHHRYYHFLSDMGNIPKTRISYLTFAVRILFGVFLLLVLDIVVFHLDMALEGVGHLGMRMVALQGRSAALTLLATLCKAPLESERVFGLAERREGDLLNMNS
jgi:hypothetical protein